MAASGRHRGTGRSQPAFTLGRRAREAATRSAESRTASPGRRARPAAASPTAPPASRSGLEPPRSAPPLRADGFTCRVAARGRTDGGPARAPLPRSTAAPAAHGLSPTRQVRHSHVTRRPRRRAPRPPLRIAGKETSASARRLPLLIRNPGPPPPPAQAGRHPHRRAGRLWGRECKQMGFYSYLTRVPCASPSPLGTKPPRRLLLLLQLLPPPPLRYSPTAATPTPDALAPLSPTHRADRVPAARPAQCGAISSSSTAPRFPLPYSTSYENGVALPLPSLRRLALITQASGVGRRRGTRIREPRLTESWLRAALYLSLREELAGRYRLSRSDGWIARTSPDRQLRIPPALRLSEAGPGRAPGRKPRARLRVLWLGVRRGRAFVQPPPSGVPCSGSTARPSPRDRARKDSLCPG